jgi:hypothetical protein
MVRDDPLAQAALELDNLYTVKTRCNGKKKDELFFLRDSFGQAAEEAGWKTSS